jgi:hypothetical protein
MKYGSKYEVEKDVTAVPESEKKLGRREDPYMCPGTACLPCYVEIACRLDSKKLLAFLLTAKATDQTYFGHILKYRLEILVNEQPFTHKNSTAGFFLFIHPTVLQHSS